MRLKERPILFSAPMVRALLAGTKTQTRRVLKVQPTVERSDGEHRGMLGHPALAGLFAEHVFGHCFAKMARCPYGAVGDRLWVREAFRSWRETCEDDHDDHECREHCDQTYVAYRATPRVGFRPVPDRAPITYLDESTPLERNTRLLGPWKPGIHLPRAYSRITLEITEVRAQRLHDITEADCWAEGIAELDGMLDDAKICAAAKLARCGHEDARATFAALWIEINGADSWKANDWVWALTFRRVDAAR